MGSSELWNCGALDFSTRLILCDCCIFLTSFVIALFIVEFYIISIILLHRRALVRLLWLQYSVRLFVASRAVATRRWTSYTQVWLLIHDTKLRVIDVSPGDLFIGGVSQTHDQASHPRQKGRNLRCSTTHHIPHHGIVGAPPILSPQTPEMARIIEVSGRDEDVNVWQLVFSVCGWCIGHHRRGLVLLVMGGNRESSMHPFTSLENCRMLKYHHSESP